MGTGRSHLRPTWQMQRVSAKRLRGWRASCGAVKILVNNAGIAGRAAPITELTDEEWDTVMAVDVKSLFL